MAAAKNIQEDNLSDGDNNNNNNIEQDKSGGFDVKFVDEINTDIITCTICHLILREPVQANPCGHRFCGSCIEKFHKRK